MLGPDRKDRIAELRIEALDKDLFYDDRLGTAITDWDGSFDIRYSGEDFQDAYQDKEPDIYLRVKAPDGSIIITTEEKVRYRAGRTEEFIIVIPKGEENMADKSIRKKIEENRQKYKEQCTNEANIKRQLALDDVRTWKDSLSPEKRAEPYLVVGTESYTPEQLLSEVEDDTEIGRMVSKTLERGRMELAKRRR
ncbi:MAG: hypothetical protein ACXQTE_05685 [Methanosarcinaceae archaeon]